MATRPTSPAPRFFATAAAFGRWLERYGATRDELVVGFHTVGSGRPCMTWPESVDEALCHGWIDGVRNTIDAHAYRIRFTPRRKGSTWSAVNLAKVEALVAQGRMRPAGLAAHARRVERTTGVYSYEQRDAAAFTAAELRRFKQRKAAWKYFEGTPPGYRKTLTHWVASARQAATRERRLDRLIEACAAGTRLR